MLTEILMARLVREIGDTKSPNFNKKKTEIEPFKQDADTAMTNLVREIQRKHFEFFQCTPHLVLSHLQGPAGAPKGGHPKSFKKDADAAMCHATETVADKHPHLFHAHSKSVLRFLISQLKNHQL